MYSKYVYFGLETIFVESLKNTPVDPLLSKYPKPYLLE